MSEDHFALLTVDVGEKAQRVKRFAKHNRLTFRILLDKDSSVSIRYGVRAHPVAYLIDTEGDVIGVAMGYREWDSKKMKALVGSLLHS